MVCPVRGERILDLGCGTGASANFLPNDVIYVGIDASEPYIETARAKYGNRRTFISADVCTVDASNLGIFDRAFAFGVLHHLSDSVATSAVALIRRVVKPGGVFVTIDPCYVPGQSAVVRFLLVNDRGKYVRTQADYEQLLSSLGVVRSRIFHDLLRIPYTQIVMNVTLDS